MCVHNAGEEPWKRNSIRRERERKVTRARDETQPGGKEMPKGGGGRESTQREPKRSVGGWCSRL